MDSHTYQIRPDVLLIQEEIIAIRRHLHENPELGYQEFETAKLVSEKLNEYGYQVITNIAKTGVIGILKGDSPGPCYLFRADMDGLPVTEDSGDPHTSKKVGLHHACGHDGHVAMLLGFAKLAAGIKSKIKGSIKLCFQPAEEGLAGAKGMLEDPNCNILEDPHVEMCFGAHLITYAALGEIWCQEGPMTANSDRIIIEIEGVGGHSSTPQDSKDALLIGCQLVLAIQSIISRNVCPQDPSTITIGKIESGTAANVISSKCIINGTTRSMTERTRNTIQTRLQEICDGFAVSFGCKITLKYNRLYDSTITSEKPYILLKQSAEKIVGKNNFKSKTFGLAGEDFSFFTAIKPSCYFLIGCALEGSLIDEGTRTLRPHHSPAFTIDERSLAIGASIWMQFLEDHMC